MGGRLENERLSTRGVSIMGWISNIFNGDSTAKPIEAFGNAANSLFTSDDERLGRAEMMARIQQQPIEWQNQLNQLNAKSESIFISGSRPFIIWVAGISLAIFYIPQFSLATYMWVKFSLAANVIQSYPISSDSLMELVYALLGISALRTVDKFK